MADDWIYRNLRQNPAFFHAFVAKVLQIVSSHQPIAVQWVDGFFARFKEVAQKNGTKATFAKESIVANVATIEQNYEVLKAFRTFLAVCVSRERRS